MPATECLRVSRAQASVARRWPNKVIVGYAGTASPAPSLCSALASSALHSRDVDGPACRCFERGLTRREREVCARAAVGMSAEATARDLGVAKTSVLTYRQRAYQRLEVASPFELCALVMR